MEAYVSVRPALLSYLYHIVGSTGEAEDVVQITFLKLFDQLQKNAEILELRGWLYKVAHNLAIDSLWCHGREESASTEWLDGLTAAGDSAEDRMIRRQQVRQILNGLNERERRCLMLRAEGLSYKEIGDVLDGELASSESSLADNRNTEVPAYNHNLFRASSDFDLRHRIVLSGGWKLPVTELWPTAPKRLAQGWRVFPIVRWRTGFPLDVFANLPSAVDFANPGPSGAGDFELIRANLVLPVRLLDPRRTSDHAWFSTTSFDQPSDTPPVPTYGT